MRFRHPLLDPGLFPDPDRDAFLCPGRKPMRFAAMEALIADRARELSALGIGRGDVVAIVLPTGPEAASLFLAVTAIACAAPLNPAFSPEELKFYLADLNARALICPAAGFESAKAMAGDMGMCVIGLESLPAEPAGAFAFKNVGGRAAPGLPETNRPDDIVLKLHTSGTTSRPKLVGLTCANIQASMAIIADTLHLAHDDRCLNFMPLFHVHGLIANLCVPLAAGSPVVLPGAFNAFRFFRWLEEYRPTWYSAVPAMHQAILTRAGRHRDVLDRLRLRFIRSASAPLPASVMLRLEAVFGCPVIEAYGMTEAVNQITSNRLPPHERRAGTVGKPDPDRVCLIDADGRRLPAGRTGEIAIRGPHVHAGYLDNPQANGSAFVDGWFRTGDEGVISQDGFLTITGRLTDTINRGGEKIAPLEIDHLLLEHPDIAEAVTFPVPDEILGQAVAVAIVPRQPSSLSASQIRHYLEVRLAPFKVPRKIILVDEIPRTATGKFQRSRLATYFGV